MPRVLCTFPTSGGQPGCDREARTCRQPAYGSGTSPGLARKAKSQPVSAWTPPPERYERGYGALYGEQITQADTGCDFAFLARPGTVPDPYAG